MIKDNDTNVTIISMCIVRVNRCTTLHWILVSTVNVRIVFSHMQMIVH